MAWDHYVTICQPLQYPIIMNPPLCVLMILASLLSGLVYESVHTQNTFQLSFSHSIVVLQFCDVPSVLRLSCSDTTVNKVLILVSALVFCGGCFIFIAMSYIGIFSTVLKYPNRAPGKAFLTCTPHILVVSAFLSSITDVYLRHSANSPPLTPWFLPS
ncbi:Olfactory receptor 14C36 [Sciurus carolinensis]|uniref:Olfactory receptor 14C36 n=1 Tax=Sciurus carolinensis TaxID=30640 RepID=A0AA41MYX0_SCICA|nr:Olfactory receptor 14C36 [Sciurus carolinensis]